MVIYYKLFKKNDLWSKLTPEQKRGLSFRNTSVEELERISAVHNPDISNYISKIKYKFKCLYSNQKCFTKFLYYITDLHNLTNEDIIGSNVKIIMMSNNFYESAIIVVHNLKKNEKLIMKNLKNKLIKLYNENKINDEYFNTKNISGLPVL